MQLILTLCMENKMPINTPLRFEEDLACNNPANFISNFPHDLDPNWVNKIIVPPYGVFFTKNMVLRDQDGKILERGKNKDYVCIQTPLRHASSPNVTLNEITGQETAQMIVIINPNIAGKVFSDLHYVGGAYSFINQEVILDALKSLSLDKRIVQFDDIRNKPPTYLPAWHVTDARDIMNMGAICFWLEKIYEAILLGDQKNWDSFYEYVSRRYPNTIDIDLLKEDIFNPGYDLFLAANV